MKVDVCLDVIKKNDTVVVELEGTEISVYGIDESKSIYLVDGADITDSYIMLHYIHEVFENE
jgi:hypothetical protein